MVWRAVVRLQIEYASWCQIHVSTLILDCFYLELNPIDHGDANTEQGSEDLALASDM